MAGRYHPAVEADIERGWMSLTVACVLILIACVGLGLFVLLARHTAPDYTPAPERSTIISTDEGIEV